MKTVHIPIPLAIVLAGSLSAQNIYSIAGTGMSNSNGDGGPAVNAGVRPLEVHVDGSGNVFVAEEDGDTVSVLLNGLVVLDHYELTHRRTTVKLPLREGLNDVVVVAHNEGRVPPNTARAVLRTGTRRTQLVLKTFLDRNSALRVTRF